MKIVLIGGGSHVFAPSVIEDLLITAKATNFDFALVDINLEGAELIASVARRIAMEEGLTVNVTATANRLEALPNANFVITSLAYQGVKRWNMDYEICKAEGIPYELRETGAISGISYSIRNITLLMEICNDMERLCPSAILLNVSNPLTRVHEAIHRYTNVTAYGFCNAALCGANGYERIAKILGRHWKDIDVTTAGINHFVWVLAIKERNTGADLLPEYIEKHLAIQDLEEAHVPQRWYKQYGAFASPYSDHVGDFLPYQEGIHYLTRPPYHGNAEERARKIESLRQVAEGLVNYKDAECFQNGSWEHPGLFAHVVYGKKDMYLPMLNLPNNGYLPQLPQNAIVEVPVQITAGKLVPTTGLVLPTAIADICNNQCTVAQMVAEAAVTRNRKLALDIIEVDQAITEKAAARQALEKILDAHGDIAKF